MPRTLTTPAERAADAFPSGRSRLTKPTAFWILAGLFLMVFFATAAASPLYRVYQREFHFSAGSLTAVFAVYVFVLLITLLFLGSVSDYLGRRPVIIAALVASAAACAVFLVADGIGALYVARALQGLATGLAAGSIGAALIELQPAGSQRAAVVTSSFSTLGLALGALITSLLVQYGPARTHLIWWALFAVFALGIVGVPAMAEPGSKRPGALASLRPSIAVPPEARGTFVGAVPCFIAVWALGGLYLSLGPSLAAQITGSQNLLWGGLVIFLLSGTGGTASFLLRDITPQTAMLSGCLFLLTGVGVTFVAIATTTAALFLAATAIAGVGYGVAFLGAFRMTTALAAPSERAGLLTAIYIVVYLAFGLPALIAGIATTRFGLHATALVYAAWLAAVVAVAIALLSLRRGQKPALPARSLRTPMPPGPCTAPPCPQALDLTDETALRSLVVSTAAQAAPAHQAASARDMTRAGPGGRPPSFPGECDQ